MTKILQNNFLRTIVYLQIGFVWLSTLLIFSGIFFSIPRPAYAQLNGSCSSDSDCPSCYYCGAGRCSYLGGGCGYTGCTSSNQCAAGEFCNTYVGTCSPVTGTGGGCRADSDCNTCYYCGAGSCIYQSGCGSYGCTSASDCGPGQYCNSGTCTNMAGSGGCTSDAQCSSGQSCNISTGTCTTTGSGTQTCKTAGCAYGYSCNTSTGRCEANGGSSSCVTNGCSFGYTCNQSTGQCVANGSGGGGSTSNCATTGCPYGQNCNYSTGSCYSTSGCTVTGCYSGYQCNSTTGQCEVIPTATPLPVNCNTNGCSSYQVCNINTGQCQDKLTDGSQCSASGQCLSGFCNSGRCAPLSSTSCTSASQCTTGDCNYNPSTGTGTCLTPMPNCSGSGCPYCTRSYQCASGYCSPNTDHCEAPGSGALCSSDGNCGANYYCNNGRCASRLGNGSGCSNGNQCQSGYCNGTCKIYSGLGSIPNGSYCASSSTCASNYCDNGVCRTNPNPPPTATPVPPTATRTPTAPPPPLPLCNAPNICTDRCFTTQTGNACSGGQVCCQPAPPNCTPTTCDAPDPLCGQITTGMNDCNNLCTKVGPACPATTYSVSGNIFLDSNKNKQKDPGERNYPVTMTLSSTSGDTTTSVNGVYYLSITTPGTYTISITSGIPAGYQMVHPKPPSFLVTVGPGCSVPDPATGGSCDAGGNVTSLNFAITNSQPWFQSQGGDMRFDAGITTSIPASPTCSGAFASIPASTSPTTPGVIFTGDQTPSFGVGQPSTTNWLVGGTGYPEVFRTTKTTLSTSYATVLAAAQKGGLPITDITTLTGCSALSSCTLPTTLPAGVYQANGDLTLNPASYSYPANENIILLVNGTLSFKGSYTVPVGSTVLYAVRDDIIIDKSVGKTPTCSATNDIEGFFTAGKNFTINGTTDCTTAPDVQLRIGGTIVVNANRAGGTFTSTRDLCTQNTQYPALLFSERPDFILNAPNILKRKNLIYQEVAP